METRLKSRLLLWTTIALAGCGGPDATSPSPPVGLAIGPQAECNPEVTDCGGGGGGGGGGGSLPGPDLNPSAPGVWLGYGTQLSACYRANGVGINDIDQDRLDDWCEQLLAQAFRPLLRVSPYDCNLGMEPRWAVNYFPAQGVARIGYLFGYYKDCGPPPETICDYSGHWSKHCTGHQGDSEFVLADVKFDATTNHWVLDRATLSAHFGEEPILGGIISSGDYTETVTWSNLQFPARSRAHFRVWVSRDKHANYRNQSTYNSGGTLNIDDCSSHSTAIENRLSIANNANVGSAAVPMIDCVDAIGTQAPFRTRTECYWSNPWRFTGWWDPAPDGSVSEVNSAMGYGMEVLPVLMEEYCWTLFCF